LSQLREASQDEARKENADEAESDVGVEPEFEAMRRADFDEYDAECAAGQNEEPAETREPGFPGETFKKKEEMPRWQGRPDAV